MTGEAPRIVSAGLLMREDGQLLLVRHRADDAQFPALWSLPMIAVGDEETAEDAIARLLRDRLHVSAGGCEFADTIYLAGASRGRYVVNIFRIADWEGEPRFSDQHYEDGAWVRPGQHGSLALVPEVRSWLLGLFEGSNPATDPRALVAALDEAHSALLEAFEALPAALHDQALQGAWTPLDVLAHATAAEACYAAESRRLLESPGHTWRPFNEAQWEDDYRTRPPEPEPWVRARLDEVHAHTTRWVRTLSAEQLGAYGNHPERGVVTVGERIDKIARHDHEHAEQLRTMRRAARVQGADEGAQDDPGEEHAAADR